MTKVDWPLHLKNFKSSGISMKEYCQQHGLSYKAMHYQKNKGASKNTVNKFKAIEIKQDLEFNLSSDQTFTIKGYGIEQLCQIIKVFNHVI